MLGGLARACFLLGQGEGGRHTQAYKSSGEEEKKWKKWKEG